MVVDSFKYLPRIITTFYKTLTVEKERPHRARSTPWTPLPKPLNACKFGLITSAGLYYKGAEAPFDIEREKREPTWGDPTYRTIPADISQADLGASHLHINTNDVLEDVNIMLPLHRFQELAEAGRIGGLAQQHYSFMGFQGFPPDATAWKEQYGPEIASRFKVENVDCVFLTPA